MIKDRNPEDNRMTMGERYGGATESSNLRVKEGFGEADLLIASGWLPDPMGAKLFRLAREFDSAHGEHGIARTEFDRIEQVASALDKESLGHTDPVKKEKKGKEADDLRKMAKAQAISARLMVTMHMKSLREVKQDLYGFAHLLVQKLGIDWDDETVAAIVGQVLDIHLDKTCHHCQGRGSNGGYGAPMIMCKHCGATGERGWKDVGKDETQRSFANELLEEMKRLMAQAAGGIKRAVKEDVPAARNERARAELADHLADLRSTAAQID